jgi:Protein of unknown function (DUF4058)
MKSPFPGMDPYIEASHLWGDFHDDLIAEIKRALSTALPRGYVARTNTRSYIVLTESEEKEERHFEPDVKVTGPRSGKGKPARGDGNATGVEEAESVSLRAFIEEDFEETFIDIYELQDSEHRLVTSIEILSPSNKIRGSKGWERYLRKRQALLLGKANLVEIDLLRSGSRMPMLDPWPASPYYLLVAREQSAPRCRAWRANFDRPLPIIPIPLSKPDPDIPLALQPMIEAIYERNRYEDSIDYMQPLDPPLSSEQASWLQQRLRPEPPAKRRRPTRKR